MKRVPDRKKMRLKYLNRQGTCLVLGTLSGVCYVPALILTIFCGSYAFISLGAALMFLSPKDFGVSITAGPYAVCFGFIAYLSRCGVRLAQEIADVPYVAPITPSTLPAEEVLVRGADEPSAPSEMLLRATVKGEETKAEELLRVASDATGAQVR